MKSVYMDVSLVKEPYVNKVNRRKRLECAKNYREKPLGFWNKVLWSDESKFNLFESDGKVVVVVWRSPKEEFGPECTIPTVKHGDDNVKCGVASHRQVWVA